MSRIFNFLSKPLVRMNVAIPSRCFCDTKRYVKVLGIETSCDDTGAAIVDNNGKILGEALHSQTQVSVDLGGVLPLVARDLHEANIHRVVTEALANAAMEATDVDAIACTNRPGMKMSLRVGLNYAKQLVKQHNKPFIPVHHMRAHALTVRMIEQVEFPFLVLLVSGGHSLLTVARSPDDFLILGKGIDEAPGDTFDKTARKLKLKNLRQCKGLSGGASVERMAREGDPTAFPVPNVLTKNRDCNFSFTGIREFFKRIIDEEEAKFGLTVSGVLPNVQDICAAFQYAVLRHSATRVQRALLYCELTNLLPVNNKTLVISGGVGSNEFLREGLARVCSEYNCKIICPPMKLCTDNGVMIAWTGVEKYLINSGISEDPDAEDVQNKCDIGKDISEHVTMCSIKTKSMKLL